MSAEKVDLNKLEVEARLLLRLLEESEESSGRIRAIESSIARVLNLVLSSDELEVLRFFERNKDLLKDLKMSKGVLRTKTQVG
jgi:hypothetical protein